MNETSSKSNWQVQSHCSQTTLSQPFKELGIPNSWMARTAPGEHITLILEMGHIVEHIGMVFKTINRDITDYAIFNETPQIKHFVFLVCKHLLNEYSSSVKNPDLINSGDIEFLDNCKPLVDSIAENLGIFPNDHALSFDLTSTLVHTTEMAFISVLDAMIQGILSQNRLTVQDLILKNDFADSNHFTCVLTGTLHPAATNATTVGTFA